METMYAFFMDRLGMSAQAAHVTGAVVMATLMFTVMALCAIVFTWMERKVAGFLQSRYGPMRTGRWHGWAQAVADMLKILGKEDIIPKEADKGLFMFAPILVLLGSLLAWAAIPWDRNFIAADFDLGLFYIFAVSSMVIIGILMSGWASNNKWALYGAARGAAQMVSYEIPLALATIPVIMYTGSLNTQDIVIAQQGGLLNWYFVRDPFLFVAFIVATGRRFVDALAAGQLDGLARGVGEPGQAGEVGRLDAELIRCLGAKWKGRTGLHERTPRGRCGAMVLATGR